MDDAGLLGLDELAVNDLAVDGLDGLFAVVDQLRAAVADHDYHDPCRRRPAWYRAMIRGLMTGWISNSHSARGTSKR